MLTYLLLLANVLFVSSFSPVTTGVEVYPKTTVPFGIGDTIFLLVSYDQAVPSNCISATIASNAGTFNLSSTEDFLSLVNYDQTGADEESDSVTVSASQRVFSLNVKGANGPLILNSMAWACPDFSQGTDAAVLGIRDAGITLSTKGPTLMQFSTRVASGSNFTVGAVLRILAQFSRDVTFSTDLGVPSLSLNSGGIAYLQGYASPDVFNILSFRYQIGTGEGAIKLDVKTFNLNSSSISDKVNQLDADVSIPKAGALGSLSFSTAVKIIQGGQKFPPLKYDAKELPATSTTVKVELELASLSEVTEKTQSFKAEVVLLTSWFDPRLKLDVLKPVTELDSTQVAPLWTPKITFANTRDRPAPYDIKAVVYNNGNVLYYQRFIQIFYCDFDVSKFPFDVQSLLFTVRSDYLPPTVILTPITFDMPEYARQLTQTLTLKNPAFSFYSWRQYSSTVANGIFNGTTLLTTAVGAERIATFNSVNILFPLSLICLAVCLSFSLPLKSDGRVSVCNSAIAATLSFSFVISVYTPPVSYITSLGLYVMLTYIVAVCGLMVQIFIRYVHSSIDDLLAKEKNLHGKIKNFKTFGKGGVWVPEEKDKDKGDKNDKEKEKEKEKEKPEKEKIISESDPVLMSGPLFRTRPTPDDPISVEMVRLLHGGSTDGKVVPTEEMKKKKDKGDGEKKKMTDEEKMKHPDAVILKGLNIKIFFGAIVLTLENKEEWIKVLENLNTICRVVFPVVVAIIIGSVVGTARNRRLV